MAESRGILLVRLDGVGDACACVPALEGLRQAIAGARFGVVCSRANAALFSRKRVDRSYVYDDVESEEAMFAELRSARYTDAIIATEEPLGYRIARASGARRRVGFWHRLEKTFKSMWQRAQVSDAVYRAAVWVASPEHEVSAMYRLAEKLGARPPIPADAAGLRDWIDAAPGGAIPGGSRTLAMQIAPKLFSEGWTSCAVATFATAALAESPFERIVLLCQARDEGLARAVMEDLDAGLIAAGRAALAPPGDMPMWLGAIASAGALITPDTGAAHAAGILGVPVVDLFDPNRFEQLSRQWRPWAAPSRCLIKPPLQAGVAAALGARAGAALRDIAPLASAPT